MQFANCSAALVCQVLRLIDEPTSAALAVYGLDRPHMPLSGVKSSAALSGQEQSQAAPQVSSVRGLVLAPRVVGSVSPGRVLLAVQQTVTVLHTNSTACGAQAANRVMSL